MRLLVPQLEVSGMDPTKWERTWDKNWEILLAVLHEEDFPLLRASQTGMASATRAGWCWAATRSQPGLPPRDRGSSSRGRVDGRTMRITSWAPFALGLTLSACGGTRVSDEDDRGGRRA